MAPKAKTKAAKADAAPKQAKTKSKAAATSNAPETKETPARASRKRATATDFYDDDGADVEIRADTISKETKPSKIDNHPIKTAKTIQGDRIEVKPDTIGKGKKRKVDESEAAEADGPAEKTAPKKSRKSKGADTADKNEPEPETSKKSRKRKVDEPEAAEVDGSVEKAAPKKSRQSKGADATDKDEPEPETIEKPSKRGRAKSLKDKAVEKLEDVLELADELAPVPAVTPDDLDEFESEEEDADVGAMIAGFDDEDDEVSQDEGYKAGQKVPKHKIGKDLKKQLKEAENDEGTGVIYVGHIPHGFHEHEMRSYFSQFGEVTKVRLSRSKKTGASKHYAFIEFAHHEVAKIVADTMNNYLMFGHILKCNLVPKEQVHEKLWIGANRRFKKVPWSKIEGRKLALPKGRSVWEAKTAKEAEKRKTKAEQMKELGYEMPSTELKSVSDVPVQDKPEELERIEQTVVVADDGEGVVTITEKVVEKKKRTPKRKDTEVEETAVEKAQKTTKAAAKKGSKAAETAADAAEEATEKVVEKAQKATKATAKKGSKASEKAVDAAEGITEQAVEKAQKATKVVAKTGSKVAEDVADAAEGVTGKAVEKAKKTTKTAAKKGSEAGKGAADAAEDVTEKAVEKAQKATKAAAKKGSKAAEEVIDAAEDITAKAQKTTKAATKKGPKAAETAADAAEEVAEKAVEKKKRAPKRKADTKADETAVEKVQKTIMAVAEKGFEVAEKAVDAAVDAAVGAAEEATAKVTKKAKKAKTAK